MQEPKIKRIKKQIDDYFLKTVNPQEKTIYQFFKKEITSKDIRGTQIDVPILGKNAQKRKYVLAVWRIPNFYHIIPWLRLALPENSSSSSIELILPVLHGDLPKIWSKGKKDYRLTLEYKPGKHDPVIRLSTNFVSLQDVQEIQEIIRIFHRKIKAYGSSVKTKSTFS